MATPPVVPSPGGRGGGLGSLLKASFFFGEEEPLAERIGVEESLAVLAMRGVLSRAFAVDVGRERALDSTEASRAIMSRSSSSKSSSSAGFSK